MLVVPSWANIERVVFFNSTWYFKQEHTRACAIVLMHSRTLFIGFTIYLWQKYIYNLPYWKRC